MHHDLIKNIKTRLNRGSIGDSTDMLLLEDSLSVICELQAQVTTHEALIEQLRFERTRYEHEMQNQLRLERMRYEHEMQNRMNSRLTEEIARRVCSGPSALLQADNKKLTEERDKAKEELDAAKEDIADLENARADDAQADLALRREINDLKEKLKNPDEVAALRKEIKWLNERLGLRIDEIVELRKSRHEWHDEKGRLTKEIKDLNDALDNPVNDVADLRKTIEKLEIELEEHRRIWPFVKRAAEEVEYAAKIGLPK